MELIQLVPFSPLPVSWISFIMIIFYSIRYLHHETYRISVVASRLYHRYLIFFERNELFRNENCDAFQPICLSLSVLRNGNKRSHTQKDKTLNRMEITLNKYMKDKMCWDILKSISCRNVSSTSILQNYLYIWWQCHTSFVLGCGMNYNKAINIR